MNVFDGASPKAAPHRFAGKDFAATAVGTHTVADAGGA